MFRLAKIQLEVLLATVLKVRKVFTGDQVQNPYANHQISKIALKRQNDSCRHRKRCFKT